MPEQVYNPDYDVYTLVPDSDDNSGSGSNPGNVQGLVDSVNNSSEDSRDSSWWSNFLNNMKYSWNKIVDFFKRTNTGFFNQTRNNVNYSVMPTHERAIQTIAQQKGAQELRKDYGLDKDLKSEPVQFREVEDPELSSDTKYGKDVNEWLNLLKELIDKQYSFNESNALRAQQFEELQAQKLRDWQEYMSSTSYQRAVADLKKAGINPLLALQSLSGASTPSGAMASGFSASGSLGSASSYYSTLASILGQNKQLGSNFLNMIIKLIGLIGLM